MKKLDIVFTKSRKCLPLFSWLIRLWTWKPYSHVALEVPISFLDKPMYFQASEGLVNYEHKVHFDKKHEIIKRFSVEVPSDIATKMRDIRMQAAGEHYGYLQNIGIALVDIAKLLGLKIKNPWKKGRNCSEIIYLHVLKPLHPELNYNPDTIKPHHIERILINYIQQNNN